MPGSDRLTRVGNELRGPGKVIGSIKPVCEQLVWVKRGSPHEKIAGRVQQALDRFPGKFKGEYGVIVAGGCKALQRIPGPNLNPAIDIGICCHESRIKKNGGGELSQQIFPGLDVVGYRLTGHGRNQMLPDSGEWCDT